MKINNGTVEVKSGIVFLSDIVGVKVIEDFDSMEYRVKIITIAGDFFVDKYNSKEEAFKVAREIMDVATKF